MPARRVVDDLGDAPVIGIEDLRAPRLGGLARNALVARDRGGLADRGIELATCGGRLQSITSRE